jgi:Holliday junction resolvase RusA-like endonuclease
MADLIVRFFVEGYPVPWTPPRVFPAKGEKSSAFARQVAELAGVKTTGRARMTKKSAELIGWQRTVNTVARLAMAGKAPHGGPVRLELAFSHVSVDLKYHGNPWGSGGDITNLFKGTEDALQGVVFDNDRQVVDTAATKRYGDVDGVEVVAYRVLKGGR